MTARSLSVGAIAVVALLALPGILGASSAGFQAGAGRMGLHLPPLGTTSPGAFAFVSNFEDMKSDGWKATHGAFSITSAAPSYHGEPTLLTLGSALSQPTARASAGFVTGQTAVSFQVAMSAARGAAGFVGFADARGPVAVVGVVNGTVYAGASPGSAVAIGLVPTNSSQPAGWVYLIANLHLGGTPTHRLWLMNVFVDRTDLIAKRAIPVPKAGGYTSAWLGTTLGRVEYTDLIFTTYPIAQYIPGYNNMDGYGQGSGLLVSVLPAFTRLSAAMTLQNWSVPQTGILGIQINAMNYTGTVRSTCKGFFQLGVDIDPHGKISPWYVPGKFCVAHYFNHTGLWPGFVSPAGTRLSLAIIDNSSNGSIDFSIRDHSVTGGYSAWQASIPYAGTEFFGTYTQIEWQPCCAKFPIDAYHLNATLAHLTIAGGNLSAPAPLPASYMIPFVLDLPPSWDMNYYDAATAGYDQVG